MYSLIFQCDDFLVVNKAPGVSVHKDDNEQPFVAAIAKDTGDKQLYLVHRLDKMTSGLLLLARSARCAAALSSLFAERDVEKYYVALSAKKPTKKQGTIIGDMMKSRRSAWKLTADKCNPAVTQFFSVAAAPGQRLFLCKPYTGKTHQIRVALKSVGSPILGDGIYGGEGSDRGYLHAYCLRFKLNGELFSFLCPPEMGSDWFTLPDEWQTPWLLNWPKVPNRR
ncbi:TIGR01621 family pseudouridine synthase [Veronia nyctiphanis]|uniref:TIGR01621 family pseudouridine synthase n=1 Tax=Veronia nyctiphanis TaxID=1278244 RepID=A0A4Q0YUD2_9GAMM|nr:TIGR01621 family pseudouridine synthase [Veronia nyctiphanis]RXJ74870.1 TIGR01621 family pseudouridine synthase [Veronia nyctiphanis]